MPLRTGSVALLILAGSLIVAISMGVRQAFGVFLVPITETLSMGREGFGLALALQNLVFGLCSPLVGGMADRFGARRVIVVGAVSYTLGLVLTTSAGGGVALNFYLGVLVGIGLSGTTHVVVLGAVGRAVPAGRRSTAFGITTAMGSLGMFACVPAAQALSDGMGWQGAFLVLAAPAAAMALLALGVAEQRGGLPADPGPPMGLVATLRMAGKHQGYLLLTVGFFVCGFHVAFIAVHLPAYLQDGGLSRQVSATALALIGLLNIPGSYLFGLWGERHRKKYLLSGLYLARTLVILAFLLIPLSPASALLFSSAIGFLWLATIPLTSGVVGQIFGMRYLSTLYGIVFLGHQLGSFAGAWLGGYAYDLLGSYQSVWVACALLGLLAAVLHWPIRDLPVQVAVAESRQPSV
jgi:predicted MFS family arabinose efflux permease